MVAYKNKTSYATSAHILSKGLRTISSLHMNYTHEMEKAMYHAHRIGFEVYCQKHEERMKVENRREQDYSKSRKIVETFVKKQHHF